MQRLCESCGRPLEPEAKRARFCKRLDCVRDRTKKRVRAHRAAPDRDVDAEPLSAAEITRRALAEVDRLETPAGVNALLLARKLDVGGDTGSAMAALSKQHLAALSEAMDGVRTAASPLDELRARREARLRGA